MRPYRQHGTIEKYGKIRNNRHLELGGQGRGQDHPVHSRKEHGRRGRTSQRTRSGG